MSVILAVLSIFLLLVAAEVGWRRHAINGEFSRKAIHILVGSMVAFWPFFLTWHQIELLSLAFLAVVGLSRQLGLFTAIHSVQRPTWGEFYFAIAVGALALLTHDKWIYAAALLQMSLADGLAAVIGVRYGAPHTYKVFGNRKSIIGTLTFFVTSLLILLAYSHAAGPISLPSMLLVAALASIIENLGVKGLDNLLVPVLVGSLLIHL